MTVIHKISSSKLKGLECILSDATRDRYGDIIIPEGWDLANFSKNPIALFAHQSSFPIGKWKDLQIKDGALRGTLVMAPEGTSPRIDELRKLIKVGILKAVSVGFHPIESEPLFESGGTKYIKQELVETSVVSVPANPNALAIAKGLGISNATQRMVFKQHTQPVAIKRVDPAAIIHARALAALDRLAALGSNESRPKPKTPEPTGRYITYRGQKIPVGWFYPGERKNWWDPMS